MRAPALAALAAVLLCACAREPRPPARPEAPTEPPPPGPQPGGCHEDWLDAMCHLVGVRNEPTDGGLVTVRASYQYENGPDRTEVTTAVPTDAVVALRERLAARPDLPCRVRYLSAPCPPHVLEWSIPAP